MPYQIYNNGASIVFSRDGKEYFLLKNTITKISILRDEYIRISTGNCLGGINISYKDVSSPMLFSASELLNTLSYWIYNITPPAGPIE
jgi:hypothetical protein